VVIENIILLSFDIILRVAGKNSASSY